VPELNIRRAEGPEKAMEMEMPCGCVSFSN